MKIRRAHVLAFLSLAIALGATGAVYQFYVKERLRELAEHQAKKAQLESRIDELEATFARTKPTVMLNEWSRIAQPWEDTVKTRSTFFQLDDKLTSESVVPEGKIPRFYYAEVYPEKAKYLQELAYRNGISFIPNYGVQDPQSISGTNPSAEQVAAWLTRMDTYTAVAEMLIEAKPLQINDIVLWPPRKGPGGRSGEVEFVTVGLNFTMGMKEFATFLNDLRLRRRYFHVDHFWISNQSLRLPGAPLNVQMLLTQAQFKEREQALGAAGLPISTAGAFTPGSFTSGGFGDAFAALSGGDGGNRRAQPKPGIMKRILNLFPF